MLLLSLLCSRGHAGPPEQGRIECSAKRYPASMQVQKSQMTAAFNIIINHLSTVVIPESSVVSGMYVNIIPRYVDALGEKHTW